MIAAAAVGVVAATAQASVDPMQVAKLLPFDGAAGDVFGLAVDVSGDFAVIGAKRDDDACPGLPGCNSGSAYIYERTPAGQWLQRAKLVADDAAPGDNFGYPVTIEGDTVVVGSPLDDEPMSPIVPLGAAPMGIPIGGNEGSAYVFVRTATGAWPQRQRLTAPDQHADDYFGLCVSISGDTIVAGAPRGDGVAVDSGAAYVFTRNASGVWTHQQELMAPDGATGDGFGRCTAINGDTIVIGALRNNAMGPGSGAAYVFNRNTGGIWSLTKKLTASDGAAGDAFGKIVAISNGPGDTIVVGARLAKIGMEDDAGAAYVFNRNASGVWSETSKLIAPDGSGCDWFGVSAEISGDAIVIGARHDDPGMGGIQPGVAGVPQGAAAMLMPGGGIMPSPLNQCSFLPGVQGKGSAYIFTRNTLSGGWTWRAKIVADDRAPDDQFGTRVAIDGETIIVGAFGDDDNGDQSGSAYMFDLNTCIPNPFDPCPPEINPAAVTGGIGVRAPGCADLNGDGVVNSADLAVLFAHWTASGAAGSADLTGDGVVNSADLSALLGGWGPCR